MIERAYILSDNDIIGADHLPDEVSQTFYSVISSENLFSNIDRLIDARLTAAEYRLYLYLTKQTLSEKGFHKPKKIIESLDISKETFYTDIARLKELGLFYFKNWVKKKPDHENVRIQNMSKESDKF